MVNNANGLFISLIYLIGGSSYATPSSLATLPWLPLLFAIGFLTATLATLPSLSFKALLFDLPFSHMASLLNSIALTLLLASYFSLYLHLGHECHILILVSYIGSISLIFIAVIAHLISIPHTV
jgi:hypothetical protein